MDKIGSHITIKWSTIVWVRVVQTRTVIVNSPFQDYTHLDDCTFLHTTHTLVFKQCTSCTASASRSAPILESTNTTMGGLKCLESWRIENSRFFLDLSSTHKTTCLTESVGALGDPTNMYTGLTSSFAAILSIDDGMVAENIMVCFTAGSLSMMSWTYKQPKQCFSKPCNKKILITTGPIKNI